MKIGETIIIKNSIIPTSYSKIVRLLLSQLLLRKQSYMLSKVCRYYNYRYKSGQEFIKRNSKKEQETPYD